MDHRLLHADQQPRTLIIEESSGDYVGEVALQDLDADNESCTFRIALVGPRAFGRGYGTEATRLIITHALETVGIHRISLQVYAFNPRARHVYEHAGFNHEGTLRHALNWHGEWIDADLMAIVGT